MGLTIREATPADNDALAALELRAPVNAGEELRYFDRRPDYFAQTRLQGDACLVVAEEGGELVGLSGAALHEVLLQGVRRRLVYIYRQRVPPERQRRGAGRAMARALGERFAGRGVDSTYWYIAPGNQVSIAYATGGGASFWPVDAYVVAVYPALCDDVEPRAVPPAQWSEAVALINRTHQDRDLFLPYTRESFAGRLGRDATYGPGDLWGRERGSRLVAVAGVWRAGRGYRLTTVNRVTGTRSLAVPATVLDYGYAEGAEPEMAALLRALARAAERDGGTHLQLGALLPDSPLAVALAGHPHTIRPMRLGIPTISLPAPADHRPIYLDPLYF